MRAEEQLLSSDNRELIATLRTEAKEVKDCFTRFSFQGLVFSTAVMALVVQFQPGKPLAGLAALPVILILTTVARIGTYKYTTANRHFGFELHLFRVSRLPGFGRARDNWLTKISWEEAMRAWRIVQSTVYEELYEHRNLRPHKLVPKYAEIEKDLWFEQASLVEKGASYYAGSYLKRMLTVLYGLAAIALIPIWFMFGQLATDLRLRPVWHVSNLLVVIIGLLVALTTYLLFISWRNDRARRKILEDGLLSIHASAIMWHAIIIAHYSALRSAVNSSGANYFGYTKYLSQEALSIVGKKSSRDESEYEEGCDRQVLNIHTWIQDRMNSLTKDFSREGMPGESPM